MLIRPPPLVQAARKKLESRRLAYDTSTTKAQRSKREDFRLEEEARSSRAKFDEANEDVLRRMQDIKEAESDSLRELSAFLDAQLDFHERCADELRRAREEIMTATPSAGGYSHSSGPPSRAGSQRTPAPLSPRRSRPALGHTYSEPVSRGQIYEEEYEDAEPPPSRMASFRAAPARRPPPEVPTRSQTFSRSNSVASGASAAAPPPRLERRVSSHQMVPVGNMRSQLRPIGRIDTDVATSQRNGGGSNVFADGYDDETPDSGSPSPGWGPDRCASPATSHSSWGKSTTGSGSGYRKAPPPPPPCRSKKPPPPIPAKREFY